MLLALQNLNTKTRDLMIEELDFDIENGILFISDRLNDTGKDMYPGLLREAINNGNDESLAIDLTTYRCMNTREQKKKNTGGFTIARVPLNASILLAEGEFSLFYIRALCRLVAESATTIELCRAKEVNNSRLEAR
jgi:hypothetical protein